MTWARAMHCRPASRWLGKWFVISDQDAILLIKISRVRKSSSPATLTVTERAVQGLDEVACLVSCVESDP
jgi:hypothetical protein